MKTTPRNRRIKTTTSEFARTLTVERFAHATQQRARGDGFGEERYLVLGEPCLTQLVGCIPGEEDAAKVGARGTHRLEGGATAELRHHHVEQHEVHARGIL